MLDRIAIGDAQGAHHPSTSSREPNRADIHTSSALQISIRKLALFALALLVSSQCLTYTVWRSGRAKQRQQQQPLVTHWKVRDSLHSKAKVRLSALESSTATAGYLAPGTIIRAYAYDEQRNSEKFIFVMTPIKGFALRKLFEPVLPQQDDENNNNNNNNNYNYDHVSPYLYEGYRKAGHNRTARYLYAPKRLVVAQQLWNALQVIQVFLALALYYVHILCNATVSRGQRWMVGVSGAVILGLLLPFSIYVTSPGATLFSVVSLLSCLVGICGGRAELVLVVGEKAMKDTSIRSSAAPAIQDERLVQADNQEDDEETWNLVPTTDENTDDDENDDDDDDDDTALGESEHKLLILNGCEVQDESGNRDAEMDCQSKVLLTTTSWFVIKEEMLGFLCNLASSLYNYLSSRGTWPHWYHYFLSIDGYFGWAGGNGKKLDVSKHFIYTLGIDNLDVPLYVPGSKGSTFGVHLFWILWSIIPTIYVSYFLCMYLLAPRSPGVKVQRSLLLFSMFHFLFMTGKLNYLAQYDVSNRLAVTQPQS